MQGVKQAWWFATGRLLITVIVGLIALALVTRKLKRRGVTPEDPLEAAEEAAAESAFAEDPPPLTTT